MAITHPDMILFNGKVLTVDPSSTVAQAVAVKGDRLAAVGSDAELLDLAGPHTAMIDLGGRAVTPGFIDTHAHMDREGLRRCYPSLENCRRIADVQALVREEASRKEPGEWVVMLPLGKPPFHLDLDHVLAERRYPNRRDLDEAAPNNPVWIRSVLGYWSNQPPFVHVLNSAALHQCGIDRSTPSPCSTVDIEQELESGELTGRILEWHVTPAAENSLLSAAPRISHEMRVSGLRRAIQLSLKAGTTSIYEGHGVASELQGVYRELHERGQLTVRTYLPISLPPWRFLDEVDRTMSNWTHHASGRGFGDDWLRFGGIYLNFGGHSEVAAINRAAWPYTGWLGFGDQCNEPDDYRELCRLAARHHLRVSTSVASEINQVLAAWETAHREYPIDGLRWVLAHGKRMDPDRDLQRIRRLGAVVTTQPGSYLFRSGLAETAQGGEENLLAHRSYLEAGIPWALSTDNKPYRMLFALWAAVARRERIENRVIVPSQKVSVVQALRAATYYGAYITFEEQQKGSLEVGKLADLIVLSGNPLQLSEDALKDLEVELTMVGGRILHSSGTVWDTV